MSEVPADLEAERSLIAAVMLRDSVFGQVKDLVTPEDFYKPQNQHIWQAINEVGCGDFVLVAGWLRDNGFEGDDYTPNAFNRLFCDPNIPTTCTSHAPRYARTVHELAARRALLMSLLEIEQRAWSVDTAVTVEQTMRMLEQMSTPTETALPMTAEDFLASVGPDPQWLIKDFLVPGNRMMVTGSEGAGKSVLLTQLAFMASAGLHPWTQKPVRPVRTLLVDLENGEGEVARRVAMMGYAIREAARHGELPEPYQPERMMIQRRDGMNLLSVNDRNWLASLCMNGQVELLVIGPIYRMSEGVPQRNDPGGEEQARQITAAIDKVIAYTGAAVIIEAHAAHGTQGHRDLRPFGSSVWLRWPDFGFGIAPITAEDGEKRFGLQHWRGDRSERQWPRMLIRNSTPWPWVADMG